MATTPIYNWSIPDNTDLVKNGALAIRTLGDAIDTTMATMTPKSIVDAKGDLIAASAADTPARLAVGNNGETLVADSSTSTGLRYTAGTVQPNPVLNSAMQVWQRGTTIVPTTTTYGADRWQVYRAATGSTFSRQLTNDTTNLPFIQYCSRFQRDSGNTSTAVMLMFQSMETINTIPFVGKTITMSFYARRGANFSASGNNLTVQLNTGTGTDQNALSYTGSSNVIASVATLTTTWQRFTYTATLGTTVNEIAPYFYYDPVGTAGAADFFEMTGVQIDVGNVALPFRTNGATFQGELAACQRYYQRSSGNQYMTIGGWGSAINTTNIRFQFPNKATMRVYPTAVDYGTLAVTPDATASAIAVTTLTLVANTDVDSVILNAALTGATQYRPYQIYLNATPSFIGVSAEL
jgi:hypothetical protein